MESAKETDAHANSAEIGIIYITSALLLSRCHRAKHQVRQLIFRKEQSHCIHLDHISRNSFHILFTLLDPRNESMILTSCVPIKLSMKTSHEHQSIKTKPSIFIPVKNFGISSENIRDITVKIRSST